MKLRYAIPFGGAVLAGIVFECMVFCSKLGEHPRLENAIQGGGVFVALLAGVIALHTADPKKKKVNVQIHEPDIDKSFGKWRVCYHNKSSTGTVTNARVRATETWKK